MKIKCTSLLVPVVYMSVKERLAMYARIFIVIIIVVILHLHFRIHSNWGGEPREKCNESKPTVFVYGKATECFWCQLWASSQWCGFSTRYNWLICIYYSSTVLYHSYLRTMLYSHLRDVFSSGCLFFLTVRSKNVCKNSEP